MLDIPKDEPYLWFDDNLFLDSSSGTAVWSMPPELWLRAKGRSVHVTCEVETNVLAGTVVNAAVSLWRTSAIGDRTYGSASDWQLMDAGTVPGALSVAGRKIFQADYGPFNTTDKQPSGLIRLGCRNSDATAILALHIRLWVVIKD